MIDIARTYQTTRKIRTFRAMLNDRYIIQSYENYMTDLTLLLVEHVRDVRWTMAVDAGLEITPIKTVNNLILSLSSQWGDT